MIFVGGHEMSDGSDFGGKGCDRYLYISFLGEASILRKR